MDDFIRLDAGITLQCAVRAGGPVDLSHKPTGAVYHRFSYNKPVLMEYLLVHRKRHMYFMHDGTPPHFLCIVSTWTRLLVVSG